MIFENEPKKLGMYKILEIIRQSRSNFLNLLNSLTTEQLNSVPAGFNNNIIWNFGHVIVVQQLLCYKLAGVALKVDDSLVSKFSKGTKPEGIINEEEIETLKKLALSTLDDFEADLKNNFFVNYKSYTTSFGTELMSIDDALIFVALHEGLHIGYTMAIKRIITA